MTDNIKDVEIRKATAEDIKLFFPAGAPRTAYSWVALYKGIPACLAGLIVERGGCIAYSEIKEGIDAPKLTIWRTALALLERIKSLRLPMNTACEIGNYRAQNFVMRLGFKKSHPLQGTELFTW